MSAQPTLPSSPEQPPPLPAGARTLDELADALGQLRAWAGNPSFTEITRRVARLRAERGAPGDQPGRVTVYDCFRPGRRRMDGDLLRDVVLSLGVRGDALEPWQVAHRRATGGADAGGPVQAAAAFPPSPFGHAGRTDELARLVTAPVGSVSVISGMPGAGKTELALAAGRRIAALRPQPVTTLFVDLRGFDPERPPADPGDVLAAFLRLLGVSGTGIARLGLPELAARFRAQLADASAVIVLDNARDPEQVRHLLPRAPRCRVIVTSRRDLPGLTTDIPVAAAGGVSQLRLDALDPADALALLGNALGGHRLEAEPAAAVRIVELCGALPLDLTVAAATITSRPDWSLDDHARRLESLAPGEALRPALAASYAQLPFDAQRMFRALVLHPGQSISHRAAAALADNTDAERLLRLLASEHLVRPGDHGMVRLHDLVAAFARHQAVAEDPWSTQRAALGRLLAHYIDGAADAVRQLALVSTERPVGTARPPIPTVFASDEEALAWLRDEHENLLAVASAAAANAEPVALSDLSELLAVYLSTHGYLRDAEQLQRLTLAHGDPTRTGQVHRRLARVADLLGSYAEMWDQLQLAAACDGPDDRRTRNAMGNTCMRLARYDESVEHYRVALASARGVGDHTIEGRALGNLGNVLRLLNRLDEAQTMLDQAKTIAEASGDHELMRVVIGNAGLVAEQRGDWVAALRYTDAAMASADRYAPSDRSRLSAERSMMLRRTGRLAESREAGERAIALAVEMSQRDVEAEARASLALTLLELGDPEAALTGLALSLDVAVAVGSVITQIAAHNGFGLAHLAGGRTDEASASYERARDLARSAGDVAEQSRAERGLGDVQRAQGDDEQARMHWRLARDLLGDSGVHDIDELDRLLARP